MTGWVRIILNIFLIFLFLFSLVLWQFASMPNIGKKDDTTEQLLDSIETQFIRTDLEEEEKSKLVSIQKRIVWIEKSWEKYADFRTMVTGALFFIISFLLLIIFLLQWQMRKICRNASNK